MFAIIVGVTMTITKTYRIVSIIKNQPTLRIAYPEPVIHHSKTCSLSPDSQRQNLSAVAPRYSIQAGTEAQHELLLTISYTNSQLERSFLTVRKKAIEALDVASCLAVPLNDNKIATSIIETPIPNAPIIIGFFLPNLSEPRAGTKEPTTKARLMQPPTTRAVFLARPTFVSNTVGA
jgi:hypothetical protein